MLSLVHETPNRMRFSGSVLQEREEARRLARCVASLPGVAHVRANPLASSLIVHHQGGKAVRAAIIHYLGAREKTPLPDESVTPMEELQRKAARVISEALMHEMIERLLGRAFGAMAAALL